jgi:beta-lactamase class A
MPKKAPERFRLLRYDLQVLRNLLISFVLAGVTLAAQTSVRTLWKQKAMDRIHALDQSLDGVIGVAAIDLTDGHELSYHGDSQFPTASAIKIPVMIQMFRDAHEGRFRFSDTREVKWVGNSDDSAGPLRLKLQHGPVQLPIGDIVAAMMQWSDNSAANECMDLAGMDRINALIRELGLRDTHLRRKMMDVTAASRGDENVSTPLELSRLLALIYQEKAADPESCRRMIALMKSVHNPYMRPGIPDAVEIAAKPGDLNGVKCEAAIVFLKGHPFVVTAMSTYLGGSINPVSAAAKIVFDYFSRLAVSNEWGRSLE